jgi:hypothetical protein
LFEFAYVEEASRQDQVTSGPGCWEFVGFASSQNLKGFHLGRFIPKPKSKEAIEVSPVMGPILDLEAGSVFVKDFEWLETMSVVA